MIKKGDRVRFVMDIQAYDMMKPYNPGLRQVSEGVAVKDEYTLQGAQVVDVGMDGEVTTLGAQHIEVINGL